jgi:hypothetical protein
MKKIFILAVTLAMVGCASDKSMPETAGKKEAVKVGMTKDQVLAAMGHKPKRIEITPRGEVWHYDNVELAAIPFNFGFRPEFKNYICDANGILIDYSISQPTK